MKRWLSLVLVLGLLLPTLLVPEPLPSAAQVYPSKPDGSTVAACANPNIDDSYTVTDLPPHFELAPFRPDAQSPPMPVTGYVPPPMDMSHLTGQRMLANAVLQAVPASYDWRDNNGVTAVKNQGACGSCFAFAAVGNFEARLKVEGAGDFDFSENNAKECTYRSTSCGGGNFYDVINLFTQKGTVLEACDPYVPSDVSCTTTCPYQKTVLDWRIISGHETIADTAVLKQYIHDYGPVYTAMYAGSSAMVMAGSDDVYAPTDAWGDELNAYDGSYTLYYAGSEQPNHAVLIVGWDDALTHAGGSGGWIVKNSWGASWGDNGYFYIAYGSARIGAASAFVKEWQDYDHDGDLWFYDEGGFWGYYGNGPTAWGLAKFLADADTFVTRVEFWTTDVTTDIDVFIYDSFNGSTLGTLLASKENLAFSEAGYHSVPLDAPLAVNSGDDVVAVVKITNQSFDKPIPLDSSPPIETQRTYVSLTGAAGSWIDVGPHSYDVAIRLRTGGAMAPSPTVTSITPNTGANNGSIAVSIAGSDFQTGATVKLTRAGETDINATGVAVVNATTITGNFDLTGAATGVWNVVVTNPDARSGTLPNGFTVTVPASPAPTVTSITPNTGANNGSIAVSIAGSDFQTGATVKLTRAGETDINATGVAVVNATTITGNFDLTGAATGVWNVAVTNPDARSGTLPNGFTVTFSGKTWTGATSTDWHTSGNWDPTGVPDTGDDVVIPDVARDPIISTADAAVNNLTINSGAIVDLTGRTLTVEGTLTNNGTLKQTQDVVQGSSTEFLRITNQAGSQTRYYGVDITSQDDAYSSSVTVAVSGNQFCANRTTGVKRCFDIDPTTPLSATVRFYFSEAERNGKLLNDLLVSHYDGDWVEESGPYTRGGAGNAQYVQAQNVDGFSLFVLDTGKPGHYTVYLPLVLKPLDVLPGFWQGWGVEFYVTPDSAYVADFAVFISVDGCGKYKITRILPVPLNNKQFSFSGSFYASGTMNTSTTASGYLGLDDYYIPGCGYVTLTTSPWSAKWVDSSQPSLMFAEVVELEKTDSVADGAFVVLPSE